MEVLYGKTWVCLIVVMRLFLMVTYVKNVTCYEMKSHLNCSEICDFDGLIADCEAKDLYYIPFSDGCTNAVQLMLSDNFISTLSYHRLSGYTHVQTLDVSRNQISFLDPGTFKNLKLRNILMQQNQLSRLEHGSFQGIEIPLRRIVLRDNELEHIDGNAFRGLYKIYSLYLNNNRIKSLPKSVFEGLQALKSLYLDDNKLFILDQSVFLGLKSLQKLHLNDNKLKWLPPRLFQGLQSLREVTLSNNKLTILLSPQDFGHNRYELFDVANNLLNLSSSIIPYLQVADRVYIDGNPFICDCDFLLVQQWYGNRSQAEKEHYESRSPIMCEEYSITSFIPLACDSGKIRHTSFSSTTPTTPKMINEDVTDRDPLNYQDLTTYRQFASTENNILKTALIPLVITACVLTLTVIFSLCQRIVP